MSPDSVAANSAKKEAKAKAAEKAKKKAAAEKAQKKASAEKKKKELGLAKMHKVFRGEGEVVTLDAKVLAECKKLGMAPTDISYEQLVTRLLKQAKHHKPDLVIDQKKALNLFKEKKGLYHPVREHFFTTEILGSRARAFKALTTEIS